CSLRHALTTPLFPYTPLFRSFTCRSTKPGTAIRPRVPPARPTSTTTPSSTSTSPRTSAPCTSAASTPSLMTALQAALVHGALVRSEEHTSELQAPYDLVCRLL